MKSDSNNIKSSEQLIVLSASRRTDLAACFPDYFVEKLREFPPEKVHSLVIWTKNPQNMLTAGPLQERLARYNQLFIHLTITGLGGTTLEPRIPPWQQVVDMLPGLLELAGDPRRITWRFDPILRAEAAGKEITNFGLFPEIAPRVASHNIATCRTSWVEPYRKVLRRVEKKGITLLPHSADERKEQAGILQKVAQGLGLEMQYCSMDGFGRSSCIDGRLLNELHPGDLTCSVRKAKGQRKLCGCTESRDIGWYSLKCSNGCLYCYAEPLLKND